MVYKVFVDGQEGTTGLQINEYLSRRRDVEVLRIDADRRKDAAERARLLNAADVAFLCLPDAAAREAVALVSNPHTCIIDASTAHRISADWAFGLPELAGQRERIRTSKRIANPGCHASAFILLVRPLVAAGLLPPDYPISCFSITGYSGGGKKMIEQYRAGRDDAGLQAPRQYGLGLVHKHLPEMMTHGGLTIEPIFAPVVAGFYKGLAVSIGLRPDRMNSGATLQRVHQALSDYFAGERFVRVMPANDPQVLAGVFFDVQGCNDTNRVDLFVFGRDSQIMLISRLDNLGKGASGAAVQSMNLHLGLDEEQGLV